MSADPRFDVFPDQSAPERKRSKWMTCAIGCLIFLVIGIVLVAIFLFWLSRNWREFAANIGTQVVNQTIDDSGLPAQEKAEVKEQVKRVADALRQNRISSEQASKFVDLMQKSPLLPMLVVYGIDKGYIVKSGLSEDEKREGRVSLERFTRGMIDKKIDQQGIDAVMSHVADRQGNGEWKMRQQVTDAELRAALAEAKARADAAQIPAQAEAVDPSDEFKRIIDEVLGEGAAGALQDAGKVEPPKAEEPKPDAAAADTSKPPATDAAAPPPDPATAEPKAATEQ
ncbi:MAG: hypothetical protein U0805_21145 [Pirellulales bacterium]